MARNQSEDTLRSIKYDPSFKGAFARSLVKALYYNKINPKINRFQICKEVFLTIPAVFHTRKNFYLLEEIDERIVELKTAGLINHWIRRYIDPNLMAHQEDLDEPKVLTFHDLTACFHILVIGYVASLIAFFCELILKTYKKLIRR